MSYEVLYTEFFRKSIKLLAKRYGSLRDDLESLISTLETSPTLGIPVGKGCYKIRMAIKSKGKGKSGGARIITCVKYVEGKVFLLAAYDKSEKEHLTEKELDFLLKRAGLF